MPERLILFKLSIGRNGLGLCTQLPKNDACKQARVRLTHPPCFGAERDMQTRCYKLFPGDSNLCGIKVSVGKWDERDLPLDIVPGQSL
jgi:hypothetical protein